MRLLLLLLLAACAAALLLLMLLSIRKPPAAPPVQLCCCAGAPAATTTATATASFRPRDHLREDVATVLSRSVHVEQLRLQLAPRCSRSLSTAWLHWRPPSTNGPPSKARRIEGKDFGWAPVVGRTASLFGSGRLPH